MTWHCPLKSLWKSFRKWLGSWVTPHSMILRGDWLCTVCCPERFEQLGKILATIDNIFIHWSVAQAGSKFEWWKKWGRKSRWTVPLKEKAGAGFALNEYVYHLKWMLFYDVGKALYQSWIMDDVRHLTHILEDLPSCKAHGPHANRHYFIRNMSVTRNSFAWFCLQDLCR